MISSRTRVIGLVVIAVAVIAVAALVWATVIRGNAAKSAAPGAPVAIRAGVDSCGAEWTHPHPGRTTFAVTNTAVNGTDVYLEDSRTGAVFNEIEGIGIGATANMSVVLANGQYRFVCLSDDSPTNLGPIVRITGAAHVANATPGIVPVTLNDLLEPVNQYRAWITGRLPVLASDVRALDAAVAAGQLDQAKTDWLTAHQEYEQLGAAYGDFGDADDAINGDPAPGLTPETDPDFSGFHKIEDLLWGSGPVSDAAPATAALVGAVDDLQAKFPTSRMDPLDLGLRAHEILEDSIESQVSAGGGPSGTALATVAANLRGTVAVIEPLRTILASRHYDLAGTDAWLAKSAALVQSFDVNGVWTPPSQLTSEQRQALNADLNETVERLAPIAAICDIRRGVNT